MNQVQVWARARAVGKTIFCGAVFATVLYLILLPVLPRIPFKVPPPVAARVRDRVALLRPGMPEAEVWYTLGLSGLGFKAHVSGSGPPHAFPANYVLWPGYVLHARWDYRSRPATLVDAEFRDRL